MSNTNSYPGGNAGVTLLDVGANCSPLSTSATGATNVATKQQTSTGSAATLVAARATRTGCAIKNTDAANSVWIGPATVTTSNGYLLAAGDSVTVTWVGLIQIIDDGSNHAVVTVWDEYA